LCWNFINIRVETIESVKSNGSRFNLMACKSFFDHLYKTTGFSTSLKMLDFLNTIEIPEMLASDAQTLFITTNRTYLEAITPFSMFEYEKLNSGTSLDDILKEQAFIKKFM
jgi:hypothetical protein